MTVNILWNFKVSSYEFLQHADAMSVAFFWTAAQYHAYIYERVVYCIIPAMFTVM